MTFHGLTALGTTGHLVADRIGQGIYLALQRFQQARPVLDFHFALQQHEPRDLPQSRTR
jgi:hypothetical protein